MKKKEPPKPTPPEELERHAGEGLSHRLSDYNDFLPDSEDGRAALAAAQLLDQGGGQDHLAHLLSIWVPPDARPFIQDIFERYTLKRNHKSRVPGYEVTEAGWAMLMAVTRVGRLAADMPVDAAIDQVAKADGIDPHTLSDCYRGRSGWFNDLRKRLAKFSTPPRS